LLTVSLVLLGVSSTGCTTVQVTDDTSGHYRLGELESFAGRDFVVVHAAVVNAFKDQGLFLTKDEAQAQEAELMARDSTDTAITVKLKADSPGRTSVKIRYSRTGDLAQSQKLYQAIEKRF